MAAAVFGWSPVIMMGRMPAPLAQVHRFSHLLPGRVDHTHEPEEHEILLDAVVHLSVELLGRERPEGDAQRTQRLARERFV